MFAAGEQNSEERIQQLSEQVKLQVGAYEAMAEVYEKYSIALARIMELLRQLHDGVKDTDDNVERYYHDIVQCVTLVDHSIKHAEETIRLDNSLFSQRLGEFVLVLDGVVNKIELTEKSIEDLKKSAQLIYETTATTMSMVKELREQNQQSIDFWRRWKIWLYTFLGIVGLIEILVQLNILEISWFK